MSYLTDSCEQNDKIRVNGVRKRPREENPNLMEVDMRMILLALFLIALAAPSHAAPKPRDDASLARWCRAIVGKEEPEATDGKSHLGQLNVQRFSDCMMGR